MSRIEVEILMSPSCPSGTATLDAIRRVALAAGVDAEVAEHVVVTEQEAFALRMPGSPTVRVAGRDVEDRVEVREDFGLG